MRIALIGSAPSSIRLAPYKDPSWCIWACSPGAYATIGQERAFQPGDAFFELHRWEPPVIGDPTLQKTWFSPEYVEWLRLFKGPVYTGEVVPGLPTGVRLPREHLIDKWGPYLFTSSLAWMLAMALEHDDLKDLGLWGVDMAATEEYATQRPACQFLLQRALERGITLHLPPESDLLMSAPLYGVGEWDPMMVKATARLNELKTREAMLANQLNATNVELMFVRGAIDNQVYWMNTWVGTSSIQQMLIAGKPPREADIIPIKGTAD